VGFDAKGFSIDPKKINNIRPCPNPNNGKFSIDHVQNARSKIFDI
jgi:hypothetical protein